MTKKRTLKTTALITAFASLITLPHPAIADENITSSEWNKKDWSVVIGTGVGYGPKAEGSKDNQAFFIPVLEAEYGRWSLGLDGLSYALIDEETSSAGMSVGYGGGRDEKDLNHSKRGIGDIDGGVIASLYGEYTLYDFLSFGLNVTQEFGDSEGLTATGSIGTGLPISENALVSFGVSTTWADENYMEAYYGVNSRQSARSGLTRFEAESGVKDVTLETGLSYELNKNWGFNMGAGVKFIQGDAKDSPIIDEDVQPFAYSAVTYTF